MPIPKDMVCDCLRCGYAWVKRVPGRPVRCPKCKQPNWDTRSMGVGRPPAASEKSRKKKAAKVSKK